MSCALVSKNSSPAPFSHHVMFSVPVAFISPGANTNTNVTNAAPESFEMCSYFITLLYFGTKIFSLYLTDVILSLMR